jgi:hypothetical protein
MTFDVRFFFDSTRFGRPARPVRHHASLLGYLMGTESAAPERRPTTPRRAPPAGRRPGGPAGPEPHVLRTDPLDILVVSAAGRPDAAGLLSGLRTHCALVCTSARQALDAAHGFDPHVVLVDLRVPGSRSLARDLAARVGPATAFIALAPPAARRSKAGRSDVFHYHLATPAAASELEHLLWRVGRDLESRRPGAPLRRDSERTG